MSDEASWQLAIGSDESHGPTTFGLDWTDLCCQKSICCHLSPFHSHTRPIPILQMSAEMAATILMIFLSLCHFVCTSTTNVNVTFTEHGQLLSITFDKSGEWSAPVAAPSAEFHFQWIDETCCWKSKLAVDMVGLSPPYLVIPFGRMRVGERIDLSQLWHSTLAAYRTKLEQLAARKGAEGGQESGGKDGADAIQKRSIDRWQTGGSSLRFSSNCPTRIQFLLL